MTLADRAAELRRLHTDDDLLQVVNVWDVASATAIALAGFALLVGCTTTLATSLKARWWSDDRVEESEDAAE